MSWDSKARQMIEAERSSVSGSAKKKRALFGDFGLLPSLSLSRVRLAYSDGIGVLLWPLSTSVLRSRYGRPIRRKDREWQSNGVKRTGSRGAGVAAVANLSSHREHEPFRGALASQ
jgi:hypothetical protein